MTIVVLLEWFLKSVGPQVLLSLGMGFVTVAGLDIGFDFLVDSLTTSFTNMDTAVFNIISLAGFPTGFGLVLGALSARLTFQSIPKLQKLL